MRPSTLRMTFALVACLLAGTASAASGKWTQKVEAGKDLYATLKTSEGDIVVRLFSKDAPRTVANFVGLATGEKEWRDPKSGKTSKKPLYAGTVFHRVIPGFMIQGGDPTGTGMGDPGYRFEDEFQSGRAFDKPGLLAMANAGPNTNGSQFFITTSAPAHLNNRHTIFGEVVKGYDVVEKIGNVPRDNRDRPRTAVVLNQVVLSDKAPAGVTAPGATKKDTGAKAPATPKP
ncbi:peptidylprolyl isomerase [Myxococcus sp. RHSTA-1-4]|uniref:peptidylprolyl isomerase n=1 Tax=Myxococcus sp. RHSTA-1-4 TaxID=2874601 RepID=UPI001CBDEF68|nr:peptidylprolyl isomerase [Myxococcus sp. RHSTA-1-4]MBZ4422042.1 peptidylprolyl isomerase [Myxococcus sp. RHSTA-1-4]